MKTLAALVLLLLGGCCPYQHAGQLRVVGEALDGSYMLYDVEHDRLIWVDRWKLPHGLQVRQTEGNR